MQVAVVIPFYKPEFNKTEKRSFIQCEKVLGNYDIIFALPEGLEVKQKPPSTKVETFDKHYFKDIMGYNKLMLSSAFYQRFLSYDYIGAPWIATKNLASFLLGPFQSKSLKKRKPVFYKVGNGGFSLRKTKSFYEIAAQLSGEIKQQLEEKQEEIYTNEDVFWSLKVPEFFPEFKIPHYKEAVGFAIDRKPRIALRLNNDKLPFGCHGIDKPKVKEFWEPIIEREYRKPH